MLKAAREFSDTSRTKMADRGVAMPDGSYPIPDKDALRRAIASFGRAKNPDAVKAHIIKRARALGAVDMLPEDWNVAAKGSMAAQHSAQAADILEDLYELIDREADEPEHVAMLQSAAATMLRFLGEEHTEIGQPGDDVPMMENGGKAMAEVKAEPLSVSDYDRWLKGDISRRMLVLPFGGTIVSPFAPKGVDIDFEYFDEGTDYIGPFPSLKASRERMVDFHHDEMYRSIGQVGDPTGVMKGAILGRVVLDDHPESVDVDGIIAEGIWGDFWRKQGEERARLVAAYEKQGVKFYGSTQPVSKAVHKVVRGYDDKWGKQIRYIDLWPISRHTLSTSPQNTLAVMPPLKAVLTADLPFDEVGVAALKAALAGLDDLGSDLRATSLGGKRAAKARRVQPVIEEAERLLTALRARQPA